MLANLFIHLGFTRDDAIWVWGQFCGAAAAIASGVFDLHYWAGYLGLNISVTAQHWITAIAVFILWLSGKMNYSHLPADPNKH